MIRPRAVIGTVARGEDGKLHLLAGIDIARGPIDHDAAHALDLGGTGQDLAPAIVLDRRHSC